MTVKHFSYLEDMADVTPLQLPVVELEPALVGRSQSTARRRWRADAVAVHRAP